MIHVRRVCVYVCVCVCVCVIGVLHRFQQSFSHITTVAVCCIRRDSARVLSTSNTYAPCRRHTYTTQSFCPYNGPTSPGFIRLARKKTVPSFVRPGPRRTLLPLGHPIGLILFVYTCIHHVVSVFVSLGYNRMAL